MGSCISCPDTGSVNVIDQFGKFNRIAEPGLSFVNCFAGKKIAGNVSMRLQELAVRCESKTMDNVFIFVEVSVQYRVTDAELYFYKLSNPRHQMLAYVYDVIRALVPKINLDDVFTTKEEISHALQHQLSESLSKFGLEIVATPVTNIEPDASVKKAMNEIVRQERLMQAADSEGEVTKIKAIKKAEADAANIRINAEADAEARYLSGVGTARQRRAIISGMQQDVKAFSDEIGNVDAASVIEVVLCTQYFNTLREMAHDSKSNTLFIPSSPAAVGDVGKQLRTSMLEAQAAYLKPAAASMGA